MNSTLDPEYIKMLSTPAPLEPGPRKDAIESLQKQIDFYVGEANKLRYAQNSHVAIFRLPAELLSEVFLYVVRSSLRDNANFVTGTFNFLQVCRCWNEVAVGSPQLWTQWVAGAVKAWPLFKSRSKDAPLSLTWRLQLPDSARDVLMDPIPRNIRELDFVGTHEQLENFFGTFDSSPPSSASSIRIYTVYYDQSRDHFTARFLSSPFPNLSQLEFVGLMAASSSPIFTTSNLTSLKLHGAYDDQNRHNQSQFSQILQLHPNLQELVLKEGGLPLVEKSRAPTPVVLPQLVNLTLEGVVPLIAGFVDLINMSSPLNNVVIHFQYIYSSPTIPSLSSTTRKLLTAYYGCRGLGYSRKVNYLCVSSEWPINGQAITAASFPTPGGHPTYNLKLHFHGGWNKLAEEIVPFFPSKNLHIFAAIGLTLSVEGWRRMLQGMKNLMHLRLSDLDIGPTLDALSELDLDDGAKLCHSTAPKLQSLSLYDISISSMLHQKLVNVLKGRRICNVGLESLIVRSCRVHSSEYEADLRDLVKVTWVDVTEIGSGCPETEEDSYSEDSHNC